MMRAETHDRAIRVLLVEDNPGDVGLLVETLRRAPSNNFDLVQVDRLSEAVRCAQQTDFDVLLLDLFLPDSHGLETVGRAHAQVPRVPIVVLTGRDNESLGVAAIRLGAQDYLVKGQTDQKMLSRALRYAAERKQIDLHLRQALHQARAEMEARIRQRTAQLEEELSVLSKTVERLTGSLDSLRENEQRLRQMIESAPGVFWIASADMRRIFFASPAYEILWGRPREELYRQPRAWLEAVHPADRPRVLRAFKEWLDGPRQTSCLDEQFRVVRPDESTILVRGRCYSIPAQGGETQYVCGTCEEVAVKLPLQMT